MAKRGHDKELRETVDKVKIDVENLSKRWSDWKLVMGPKRSESDDLTMKRAGSGYTISNLRDLGIEDECGIYEFAIVVKGGRKKYPVYLGSTCRCDKTCKNEKNKKCGLKTRISEYCQHGSHKATVINQAIDHENEIYVSTRKVHNNVKGWEKKEKAARAAEDALLEEYDYAWNIRGNDKDIPRSVKGVKVKEITGHNREDRQNCPFCKVINGL